MKIIRMVFPLMAVCMIFGHRSWSQENNSQGSECQAFENASPSDLTQFLNAVLPDKNNEDCVAFAIRKVGAERYEPAIPSLVKLLDFRRPLTPKEKAGFYDHPQGVSGRFPAVLALEMIGKNVLPEVLRAMKAESTTAIVRENALFVWMENYRHERPMGVALLRQEETNATDDATKQRLRSVISQAVDKWCGPKDHAECKAAAEADHH